MSLTSYRAAPPRVTKKTDLWARERSQALLSEGMGLMRCGREEIDPVDRSRPNGRLLARVTWFRAVCPEGEFYRYEKIV